MSEWRNLVIQGECLEAMEFVAREVREPIDLIYLDPPFFSNTDYWIREKGVATSREAAPVQDTSSYSDRWEGGMEEYLNFMRNRLERCYNLLGRNGSLWVHLDFHISHYVKVMLDEIFGYQNFINEIIWRRTNSPKAQSRGFGNQHDVILLYAKDGSSFAVNQITRPIEGKSLKPYSYEDARGRFRLIEIEAQGIQKTQGRKRFEWRGRTAPYLYSKEKLDEWWEKGLIYRSRNGRYTKKQYLKDVEGIRVSDLWLDIPPLQGSSKEYAGFLTQKPVSLLNRVLKAGSNEQDLVADFFAGSGTLAVAAHKAKRRWIICDASEAAIATAVERLKSVHCETYDIVRL